MKELIEYIVRSLVDDPDQIDITEEVSDTRTLYQLKVRPEEAGKIIGKNGKTAKAIRTLLSAAGAKAGKKLSLQIVQ